MPGLPDIPAEAVEEIGRRLDRVEAEEGVKILLAVESGSRAWGFPSPDSDYDARFIYLRPRADYLRLTPVRDVIERPILDDYDVNGWDVRKALLLMRKANPVLLEWLRSPIIYRETGWIPDALRETAAAISGAATAPHYWSLMDSQLRRHFESGGEKKLKAYFYVLRPALALRWIRQRGETPPMDLPSILAGVELGEDERGEIARLVELKSRTKEIGAMERVAVLDAMIGQERDWWSNRRDGAGRDDALEEATEALFQKMMERGAD